MPTMGWAFPYFKSFPLERYLVVLGWDGAARSKDWRVDGLRLRSFYSQRVMGVLDVNPRPLSDSFLLLPW